MSRRSGPCWASSERASGTLELTTANRQPGSQPTAQLRSPRALPPISDAYCSGIACRLASLSITDGAHFDSSIEDKSGEFVPLMQIDRTAPYNPTAVMDDALTSAYARACNGD